MSPLNLAEILLVLVDRAITAVIQAWGTGQHFFVSLLWCHFIVTREAILLWQGRPFYLIREAIFLRQEMPFYLIREAIFLRLKRCHFIEIIDAILLRQDMPYYSDNLYFWDKRDLITVTNYFLEQIFLWIAFFWDAIFLSVFFCHIF